MSFTGPDSTGRDTHHNSSSEEPRLPTRRDGPEKSPALPMDRPFPSLVQRVIPVRTDQDAGSGIKRRRWLHRTFIALCLLLIVAIGSLFGVAGWLRRSMHASLPQLDGEVHVQGLSDTVTVTRNAQGVPSIQAANLDDLLFAQGYVTAQDRLWQMDALRRHAAGELAEVLGSKLIKHDKTQRILQLRASADRAVAALPADQLHQLESYARGVNAFIDQNGDKLPVEFHLLRYKPAPWTPRDTLLVSLAMYQDLSTAFPTKMKRETLSAHLPAQLLADLYPVGSWRDRPPSQPPPDLTTPKPEIEEIPLDDTQVKLRKPGLATPTDVIHVAGLLNTNVCEGCRAGSNNWAVAGSHSASGFPLVSNDMHLSLSVPDIWYEAVLHCAAADGLPALDVSGFTLPGAPFVIVGRNEHVAWGFTNSGADVQDVRIEHTRGSGSEMEFEKPDGTWDKVGHAAETIHVRGGHDVVLDVLTTSANAAGTDIVTPVITPLYPSEQRTLSLAWTAYDPHNLTVPFFAVNTASSGASLIAAMASFGGPSQNLVYADDAKHIGYHTLGKIPIRGSTTHTPRPVAGPPILQNDGPRPPAADEDEGGPSGAQAAAYRRHHIRPVLLDAAYRPARRRTPAKRERDAAKPEPALVIEKPIPPPPPAIDYTVGSAISSVPVDALDASQQWVAYIPYNELPSVVDHASGIIATANARISPDDYPYSITNNWSAPYRVERINRLLTGRAGLKPSDMLAIQNDIHSEFDLLVAQRLSYALDHASPSVIGKASSRAKDAADILRKWDGNMSPDSSAAAIVNAFRKIVWEALLTPQVAAHDRGLGNMKPAEIALLYQWEGQTVALEDLLQHTPAHWLPPGTANWSDLLTSILLRALNEANAPSNLRKWRYGPEHPVEIAHPVFSSSPLLGRLIGRATGTGPRESGGDGTTIRAIGLHFGSSERFDADLGDAQRTLSNITTGESGNPESRWYLDQFPSWLGGTSFTMPLSSDTASHSLKLLP